MQRPSTARFMAYWVLATAPFEIAGSLLHNSIAQSLPPAPGIQATLFFYSLHAAFLIPPGLVQSRLLSRYRRPVAWWAFATVIGGTAGSILAGLSWPSITGLFTGQSVNSFAWLWTVTVVGSSGYALSRGAVQALALWGWKGSADVLLWMTGTLAISVLGVTVYTALWSSGPQTMPDPTLAYGALSALDAVLDAAGTAWLLDRLAFRDPR